MSTSIHPVPCYDGQDDNGLVAGPVTDAYSRALERTLDQKLEYIVGLERTVAESAEALVAWVRRADALQARMGMKELEAFEAGIKEGRREHYDNFRRLVIYLMFGVPAVAGAAFVLGWWLR